MSKTTMAEKGSDLPKLSEIFTQIWKIHEFTQSSEEPTNSDSIQNQVRNGIEKGKLAVEMVNKLGLFSDNEELDEVATYELRYMLLPVLLADLTMKVTIRERLKVVQEAQCYYTDYMRMCRNYGVTKMEVPDIVPEEEHGDGNPNKQSTPGPPDMRSMVVNREDKIRRYKEQKELEKKLQELHEAVIADKVEEEVKRDYYMTLLKKWVNTSIEELQSIHDEIGILKFMAQRKNADSKEKEKHHQAKHNATRKPLRPFIITKDMIQKKVLGAGYPSLPTMTIEEFYEQKVKEGSLHTHSIGHSMQNWAEDPDQTAKDKEKEDGEEEEKEEKDDPEALQKKRDWDDWKDDHRRGWGNRQNMG